MKRTYPLDSSAIIHLASMTRDFSNIYRFTITLRETIRLELLQQAFDAVAPRFPVLIAGIQEGFLRFSVVPVDEVPKVRKDPGLMQYMSREEIRRCAMRLYYGEDYIAAEFFHSLTDGYGALTFLRALMVEYLGLVHGLMLSDPPTTGLSDEECSDAFLVHAGEKTKSFSGTLSYLPGKRESDVPLTVTTEIFDVQELLSCSHRYGVSLNTFLTAVMMEAMMELQFASSQRKKPVQLMIPINLRRKFPSKTLQNFSLYALPRYTPEEYPLPFEELVASMDRQLKEQFTEENLRAMLSTSVALKRNPLLRILPLPIKCLALRIGNYFLGGRTSSLTLTNLGEVQFPPELYPYIQQVGVVLSERAYSPYNCGALSYQGKLYFTFSRKSRQGELEQRFFGKLKALLQKNES